MGDTVSTSTPSTNEAAPGSTNEVSPSLLLPLVTTSMVRLSSESASRNVPALTFTELEGKGAVAYPNCLMYFVRLVALARDEDDKGRRLEPQGGGSRLSGGEELAAGSMVGYNNA